MNLTENENATATDDFIENTINEINPNYTEINELWLNFMSINEENEYKKEFNTTVDGFNESQIAYIKYLLLNQITTPELAADCVYGNLL